ncbi:MAG TPA: 3-methyl-2-oxobutanoate dehydrogenase subunit beta, partial [Bacillota bacterium]
LIQLNERLQEKYRIIEAEEQRAECLRMDDADYAIVAFGIVARLASMAVDNLREKGHRVGMIRPITLWPFPAKTFQRYPKVKGYLSVEMNEGQMVQDVRLNADCAAKVRFYGHGGGWVPTPAAIEEQILKMVDGGDGA